MYKVPEWLILLAIVLVGVIISFSANPILVWSGLAVAFIGAILLGKPYRLFILLISWSMTAFIWNSIFRINLLARADDIMMLLILAVFLGNFILRRVKRIPYMKIYLLLVGLVFFSKVVNGSGLTNLALFLLAYCAPFLVFCLIYTIDDKKLGEKFIKLILLVFLFGVVLNLGWYLRINPIPNIHYGTIDFAKGSLGSCDTFAYFTIIIIFLLLSLIRQTKERKKKLKYGWLLSIAFVQLYLTYTNHAYLYFIALFVVYLVITRQRLSGYIALSGLAIVLVGLLSTVGQSRMAAEMDGYQGFRMSDPKELQGRFEQFQESHKVDLFNKVVINGYEEGFLQYLIGHGPGAGVGTVARNKPSDYTFRMLGEYYLTYSGRLGMAGASITQSPWSGISSLWSEVGMLGTLLFFMLFLLPVKIVVTGLLKGLYENNGIEKVTAEFFVMFLATFFVINLMKDFWCTDYFIFPLWALAAICLKNLDNDSC